MKNLNLIGPWVRRFLVEYVIVEKNLSKNTQHSYRDTFSLLLPFVAKRVGIPIDKVQIEQVSPDSIREFFKHLQTQRACSPRTCNQRLACIHGFAQFIAWKSPEFVSWAGHIRTIPFKKTTKTVVPYLEKTEIDVLLAAPDLCSKQGHRDRVLLLFLYNTGARASEVAELTIEDLELRHSGSVKILGKGNKLRYCPLWKQTVEALKSVTEGRPLKDPVFLNRLKKSITRFGIHNLVETTYTKAKKACPSLELKRVSPHTIRHTTAVHLLRSGVDINTIRAWLGHVSIDTTNIYAEVDLEMKSKALALCKISKTAKDLERKRPSWKEKPDLMNYLKSL